MTSGRRIRTAEEQLEYLRTHVRRAEGGCLLWAGPYLTSGHPKAQWAGRSYPARRLLLELAGRPLRAGQVASDTCGERTCMAEEHLVASTKGAVLRRLHASGAGYGGVSHGLAIAIGKARRAKLPITERDRVFARLAAGHTYAQIAEDYGVRPSTVGHAVTHWRRYAGGHLQAALLAPTNAPQETP